MSTGETTVEFIDPGILYDPSISPEDKAQVRQKLAKIRRLEEYQRRRRIRDSQLRDVPLMSDLGFTLAFRGFAPKHGEANPDNWTRRTNGLEVRFTDHTTEGDLHALRSELENLGLDLLNRPSSMNHYTSGLLTQQAWYFRRTGDALVDAVALDYARSGLPSKISVRLSCIPPNGVPRNRMYTQGNRL